MATLNSKTIGSGGDYATLALWLAACPTDLTAADATGYIYQGKLLESVIGTAQFTITGITGTDSTHYIELTTATGCSFIDNANVRTNALRYNEANGVGIRITSAGAYAFALRVNVPYTRISKLQFSCERAASDAQSVIWCDGGTGGQYVDINQCIIETVGRGTSAAGSAAVSMYGPGNKIRNSAVICRSSEGMSAIAYLGSGAEAYNCSFISLGMTVALGIYGVWGTPNLKNVYVGGATVPVFTGTDSPAWVKTNCYADVTTSGWTVAPLSTVTFESITNGTHDLRLKAGSALIDAGATDSTYAANDITGLARSGTWDVGAWESAAAGTNATGTGTLASITLTAPAGTATGTSSATNGAGTGSLQSILLTAPAGTATGTSAGAGTISSPVMKNNTGTVLANETGVIVNVYNASTGALIVQKTGQTSNASGIVTISDALIVPATTYAYEVVLTGSRRRLPTASAA